MSQLFWLQVKTKSVSPPCMFELIMSSLSFLCHLNIQKTFTSLDVMLTSFTNSFKKSSRNFCAWQIQGSGGIGAWLTTLLTWHPKKMPADQFAHIFISLTWAPLMHGFTFSTGFLRS